MEVGGFLVSPTQVVLADPLIHPRFIEGIAVRFGDDLVKAKPQAYAKNESAMVLELERPLKGTKPLTFDAKRAEPYLCVTYAFNDGAWVVSVDTMPTGLDIEDPNRRLAPATMDSLVVDKTGAPVGVTMVFEVPADDSWKGSPLEWPLMPAADLAKLLADAEQRTAAALLPVTVCFRSPRNEAGRNAEPGSEEDLCATEQHITGVLVGPNRILILANLRPKTTARLESILVHPPKGDPVPAKFACSLSDYGAIVATLEKPLDGAVALSTTPILDYRNRLLPAAEIQVHGEDRALYFEHRRIEGFDIGWRRQIYPDLSGRDDGLFLFDTDGALVAIPVAHREKVVMDERDSGSDPRPTPVAYLKGVLENLQANSDAHNVPVTEEEEARLAWLGVELQPLNAELAREHKVSEQTHDGRTGAVVSYVYAGSPAAKAGVKVEDVLLRLMVEGQAKPLEVVLDMEEGAEDFPWHLLDRVPEEAYDRIPTPWPSAENRFTRALTDLGFGKKFTAEFFRDGKVLRKDFVVEQSPPHYGTAPRFKSAALGLTVRNLTYELRRYFKKEEGEPGVIVSQVEPGGKASVGGIKPYEIITHVNDVEVKNIKEFEKQVSDTGDELRLTVKRMTQGRVVKIKMGGAAAKSPETPAPVKPKADTPAPGKPVPTPTE